MSNYITIWHDKYHKRITGPGHSCSSLDKLKRHLVDNVDLWPKEAQEVSVVKFCLSYSRDGILYQEY